MVKLMCLFGHDISFSTTVMRFQILLKNQRPNLMPVSCRGIHIELMSHLHSWLPVASESSIDFSQNIGTTLGV